MNGIKVFFLFTLVFIFCMPQFSEAQEMQDVVQNISEQTEKLFQGFLSGLSDWLAENERFASSVR